MSTMIGRIVNRCLEAAQAKPEVFLSSYDDWLDNNPAVANLKTISPTLMRKVNQELNLNAIPLARSFFEIADHVHHMSLGAPVEDLSQEFRTAAKYLSQAVLRSGLTADQGAELANSITDCAIDSMPTLRRIGAGATGQLFFKVGTAIALVVEKIARALGMNAGHQVRVVDGVKWPTVRTLSKKEDDLKSLQENNPKLYDELKGNLEKVDVAIKAVHKKVIDAGLVPTTLSVNGVLVPAGEDYISKEKVVHLPDGRVLPEKEFRRELSLIKQKDAYLVSEFTGMAILRPEELKLGGARKLTDEDLSNPEIFPPRGDGTPQPIEYRALTDDKSAAKNTRIYPTRVNANGDAVIVDGRFKGFYLDDMVNAAGRLVEGAAYDMDASGLPVSFETRDVDGGLANITANKEPYVTLDTHGKFIIKIPVIQGGGKKKDPYTLARNNMERVSSKTAVIDPKTKEEIKKGRTKGTSILELPVPDGGSTRTLFTFDAVDFATVRTAVGGMVMSASAAKKIRGYYAQMARQEEALRSENTKKYSLDRIGGFKTQTVIDPTTGEPYDPPRLTKDLQSKQKEAISWLEAKGYKGLVGLDTGVGKTLCCIATMQKMVRDGAAEEGSRFLYVCPGKLVGNFPREMEAWMTKEAMEGLRPRVDVMSYDEFTFLILGGTRTKKAPVPGTEKLEKVLGDDGKPVRDETGKIVRRPIPGTEKMVGVKGPDGKAIKEKVIPNPDFAKRYAAVFFDEAHALVKNENSAQSKAAQKLDHPRKILLTASPMEDDPDELYVGVAITNNVVVASEGTGKISQARKDLMAFRRRFCVRVAGRTVGIKNGSEKDPTARQDFDAWAKNGLFFADKRSIGGDGTSEQEQGLKLPTLSKQAVSLTMTPEVEIAYKQAAKGIAKVLKGLVALYRDKTLPPANVRQQVEAFQSSLRKYTSGLNALANYPDEVLDASGKQMFPGAVSPKVVGATMLVHEKIQSGKRTLLFTDDPKFALISAEQMSAQTPGAKVACALSDRIVTFLDGAPWKDGIYTSREYTRVDENGKTVKVPKAEWASHVLREIIGGDPSVVALVLTKTYALGQNLQMFSTVVHLDRDSFSNEMMKQRTARAWRTGQKNPVEEYTLDSVYDSDTEKDDPTLDEVRKYIQESQETVFNDIVHKSREAIIGQEWKGMREAPADLMNVNRKLFEMSLAPYTTALGENDYSDYVKGN